VKPRIEDRVPVLRTNCPGHFVALEEVPRETDMKGTTESSQDRTANPPGGVAYDITQSISSNFNLSQDMQAFLKTVIIPCIRPDVNDSVSPQIVSEWQIANIEPNLCSYNISGEMGFTGTFRASDLFTAANSLITSIYNGQASSDLALVFEQLVRDNGGPDWLSVISGVVGAGFQIAKAFI